MENHSNKIYEVYRNALRRKPSSTEVTYWLQVIAMGGTYEEIRADIVSGYEFEAELNSLFWEFFRMRPDQEQKSKCRAFVVNGSTLSSCISQVALPSKSHNEQLQFEL